MGSVCGYKPPVSQKLYPHPSLHPEGGLDFIIFFFYSSRLNIFPPSGVLWLCNSTFFNMQKLTVVNLTTALKENTYSSLGTCSSSVPLNILIQVAFTHEILDILHCSSGQSWLSSCVTVSLIHLWPSAGLMTGCIAVCLTRRWKSPSVERGSHLPI